jgi:hypothetical protein
MKKDIIKYYEHINWYPWYLQRLSQIDSAYVRNILDNDNKFKNYDSEEIKTAIRTILESKYKSYTTRKYPHLEPSPTLNNSDASHVDIPE